MMTQQIVRSAKGALSESEAQSIDLNGLKDMGADDAPNFANIEKAALRDGANMRRPSEQQEARQIIEAFNNALSEEDYQHLLAGAESKMTQQIVDNSNGALSEKEARDIVRNGIDSMTDEDAQQIIDDMEEMMSIDHARQFVNAEKAMLSANTYMRRSSESVEKEYPGAKEIDGDEKIGGNGKFTKQQLVQRILVNFRDSLDAEGSKELSKIVEDSLVERILDNALGRLTEKDARQIIHNAEMSMTNEQANQIIANAAGTMRVDDAQNLVNDLANQIQHSEKAHTKQIIENFNTALSKEDAQALQKEAEAKMTQQIIENSNGALNQAEARDIVRKGEESMSEEDAEQIIKQAEETMSVDDARRFVNVEKEAILDSHIEQSSEVVSKEKSMGEQAKHIGVGNVKGALGDSETNGIVRSVEKRIIDGAERIMHRAETAIGIDDARTLN